MAADLADQICGAYSSFTDAERANAGEFLDRLADCLGGSHDHEHPVFNLDALHSWIGYRSEKRLYVDLLERSSARLEPESAYTVKCGSYHAEMLRRHGQLDLAEELFHKIRAVQESAKAWQELSRTWYGLAYISFLRGLLKEAAQSFERSVQYAEDAWDTVGSAISRCMAGRARFLGKGDASSRDHFRRALLEAGEVFENALVARTVILAPSGG